MILVNYLIYVLKYSMLNTIKTLYTLNFNFTLLYNLNINFIILRYTIINIFMILDFIFKN